MNGPQFSTRAESEIYRKWGVDVIGMTTIYNVLSHWGKEHSDAQMIKNAAYLKENFIDKGRLGLTTGAGYYTYPDPAYQAAGFLDVPDVARAAELGLQARLT